MAFHQFNFDSSTLLSKFLNKSTIPFMKLGLIWTFSRSHVFYQIDSWLKKEADKLKKMKIEFFQNMISFLRSNCISLSRFQYRNEPKSALLYTNKRV